MTRLYIFEGVPGSGKTSTAKWLAGRLGESAKLFLEGDPNHPADYERVACLTEEQITQIEKKFPSVREKGEQKGERYFIPYACLYEENKPLFEQLTAYDVYELPVEAYMEVALNRWKEFVQEALDRNQVYILECCYLQNPLTFLLAKHNCSPELIYRYLNKVTELISRLDPVVVYFEQDNLSENLNTIRGERPVEWFDFLTWYYTEQEYGKERGLSGLSGVLYFLEERKQLEIEFLSQATTKQMQINNTSVNWEEIHSYLLRELRLA